MASSTDDLPCVFSGMAGHSREGDTTHSALPDPPRATEGRDCTACRLPHCLATHTPQSKTGPQRLFLSGRKPGMLRESPLRPVEMNSRLAGWVFMLTWPPRYNWADSEHSSAAPDWTHS